MAIGKGILVTYSLSIFIDLSVFCVYICRVKVFSMQRQKGKIKFPLVFFRSSIRDGNVGSGTCSVMLALASVCIYACKVLKEAKKERKERK
jgi:hypothetical protein